MRQFLNLWHFFNGSKNLAVEIISFSGTPNDFRRAFWKLPGNTMAFSWCLMFTGMGNWKNTRCCCIFDLKKGLNILTNPFHLFRFWRFECTTLIIKELLLDLLHIICTNISIFVKAWQSYQILRLNKFSI